MKRLFLSICMLFQLLQTSWGFAEAPEECPPCPDVQPCPECPVSDEGAEPEDEGWDLSVAFGFNLTRGNSDTILLNLNAAAELEQDKNIWSATVDGAEGSDRNQEDEENGDTTQRNVRGDLSYKRLLSERLYLGTHLTGVYDDIADIDYRFTFGVAPGYFLLKDPRVKLSAELGPALVAEKLAGDKNQYLAARAAERFNWDISKHSKLFQSLEVVVSTEDADDSLFTAEAGLEAAINSKLSLVLKLKDVYDNQPAEDTERNDLSVVSALKLAL